MERLQARRKSIQLREMGICDKVEDALLAHPEDAPSVNTVMKRKLSLTSLSSQPHIDKEATPRK